MVGRTVSHYQILEKLGTGGMGEIYRALDPRLNRVVAIKVLASGMSADPARRRRFVQEAQTASGLNHPNIITIHDVVSEPGAEYIVMEYVAGKTLLDLIPKGGLRVPQLLNYGVQMADALSAAHAAGIIHRDLKPGNVMVTDSGLVKVLDFGLAKLERGPATIAGDDIETVVQEAMTVEGSIMGTVSYMSPEQAQGKRVDTRSDIFSFGVLLYEMATGARPFGGDSAIQTLSSILRDEPKPMALVAPDVPARLQEVIMRCLRKDPDERWQTMKDLQSALTALKQESQSGTLYHPEIAASIPQRTKKRPVIPVAVGAVVLVGAAGAWWFIRSREGFAVRHETAAQGSPVTQTPPAISPQPVAPPHKEPSPIPPAIPKINKPPMPADPSSVAAPSAPPPAPAEPAPVAIQDGVPIGVALAQDIPVDAPKGMPLRFTVNQAVLSGGKILIAKGAVVRGQIADENKKKLLVLGAKMTYLLSDVEAVDGQKLKVRAVPVHRSDGTDRRPVDVGRPHPKGFAAASGTEYVAYIDGDQTVAVRK